MLVSECCSVPFPEPGYPDTDLCGSCHEHTGAWDDEPEEGESFVDYRVAIVAKNIAKYAKNQKLEGADKYLQTIFAMDAVIADFSMTIEGMRWADEEE